MTSTKPQMKIVVALDPAAPPTRHWAYATGRRTLCLELSAYRALRGRGQHGQPDCQACQDARERVREAMRQLGLERRGGTEGGTR